MATEDPRKEEYLAVVSSWATYGQKGGQVGRAYPIFCVSRNEVVHDPLETFPDPGYIFLVNRASLSAWDFFLVRPRNNDKYSEGKAYYISFEFPQALDAVPHDLRYAMILDVPGFDPVNSSGVIRNPVQNVTPIFYIRNQRRLFGPMRRLQVSRSSYDTIESIAWVPFAEESSFYEFAEEELPRRGLERVTFRFPNFEEDEVVYHPYHLLVGPVLAAKSDKIYDRLSESQLAEWYLRWRDLPPVDEPLLKTFRTAADNLAGTTSDVVRQRLRRLANLFTTLDTFQNERTAIAKRYLDSEEGKRAIKQLEQQHIERRSKELEAEVERLRGELGRERQRLAGEWESLQTEHQRKQRALQQELERLEAKRATLESGLSDLEGQLQQDARQLASRLQEHVPILAAMTAGFRPAPVAVTNGHAEAPAPNAPPAPAAPSPSTWGKVTVPEPTKELDTVKDESAFVDHLAWELGAESLYFTRDFLANLYVTLKASALNLIMGPPGYGKSSVVTALARAMGHGNAMLEVAVRRTWSDDRYLLGFFDTFHGRYDPGPTGLATRLLQAQRDWELEKGGIYLFLMDEFNLAAPEYYFSQLLQTLTRPADQPRVVRLFDAAALPPSAEKPVDQIRLHPNVSFWGTINYDETTERLSPRLLDRTGMIFLNARDVLPSVPSGNGAPAAGRKGVRANQVLGEFLRSSDECPDSHWELIDPLLAMLKRQTEEWGPGIDLSPRVLEAIKRYLANSVGLLSAAKAVDFVFEQRVLPVLRGRGPKFAARMRALEARLTERGLDRSARHVQDAIALAEVNFGDVDFLAY